MADDILQLIRNVTSDNELKMSDEMCNEALIIVVTFFC